MALFPNIPCREILLNSGFVVSCGHRVNDKIALNLCSVSYVLVGNAVNLILELGQGTDQVKVDVKGAYYIVLIHPHDHLLLATSWGGRDTH